MRLFCLILTALLPLNVVFADTTITVPASGNNSETLAAEARDIVKQYAGALQKTLKASIMTSGPASAIRSCQVHAPGISQQTAALTGWQVARTSEKFRNPNNQPNRWEREVLSDFSRKAEQGTPIGNLEHYEIINENGQATFRYMKAIEVNNLCLNCHGTHVSGPVKEAIRSLFPADQATGYRNGDLRGAFTLKKTL